METPCIKVCVIEPATGLREGCGRALAEIVCWTTMTPAERRRVIGELSARRGRIKIE